MTVEKVDKPHPVKKRSRNGCLSCKKLRIKCNEAKPSCEYCVHTSRECIYPIPKPTKSKQKLKSLYNQSSKIELLDDSASTSASTSNVSTPASYDPASVLFGPHSPFVLHTGDQNEFLSYHRSKSSPTPVDDLTRTLMLNQSSQMLGISKFELRLLKFFDSECIQLFSYGVNEGIYNAWKYKVPSLFLESDLVRQSIFAFSAIGLSATLDLEIVQSEDNGRITNFETSKKWDHNLSLESKTNLYLKTTSGFLRTLKKASEKINELHKVSGGFQDPTVAKELVVSSILIFSFLGVQPHKLIKLISFNREEEETDMIQISSGTRDTVLNCAATILKSDMAGLLFFKSEELRSSPSAKDCGYPIINYLMNDMYSYIDSLELSLESSQFEEIFGTNIDYLTKSLYGSHYYKFPIPIFRFLMVITENFKKLLYSKNQFALKILFVYASIASIARFQMYNEQNIWREYLIWYKEEYGLSSEMEKCLYYLVVQKHFMSIDFENFPFFDPIEEYKKQINTLNLILG
ncbi:hypothetical protein KGF54_000453 [Candida jiufengensis]|uniref:uncharacterized protein n=1 Tax=Candida jiufengensis TaxID=497108 RepID=UPI002224B634|nr:uncharacterized protein KGF54_000453 [Candida jiufengensis]KAI5956835.1 hypothetical protein KGF54_000453 [Candida jiufengensis]